MCYLVSFFESLKSKARSCLNGSVVFEKYSFIVFPSIGILIIDIEQVLSKNLIGNTIELIADQVEPFKSILNAIDRIPKARMDLNISFSIFNH